MSRTKNIGFCVHWVALNAMNWFVLVGTRSLAALFVVAMTVSSCLGCSVLSHEAIVDALWDVKLKPVLLARYPHASEQEQ